MFGSGKTDCEATRADLVAWADGALRGRRQRRLTRHVSDCPRCAKEADGLRAAIGEQEQMLRQQLDATEIDLDTMWNQQRLRLAHLASSTERRRGWIWRPALAIAAASLALTVAVGSLGGSHTLLIAVGLQAPPPPLKRRPDLFREYPIIRQLDVLERFDTADIERLQSPITPEARNG